MANDLIVAQDEAKIAVENIVVIDDNTGTSVQQLEPVIQVAQNEFVLSSGGMYGGGNLVGAIPDWILQAINQELTTGSGSIMSVVQDMQTLLNSLQTGVSQVVASLNTLSSSTSSITTSLQSQVDANKAEALNLIATKVDATQAAAIVATGIQSTFGPDINSYIGSIASTYVSPTSAIGQEISLMQTSLNGVTSSISDISSLTTEIVQNPLWVNDGLGTDPDASGNPRWIVQAKAKKQLSVDANGVISGILLESGATSNVTIQADNFSLVATGQAVAARNPFTVNATTGEINFNGVVDFTATNASGTTTIDGSKITTGSITANQIAANTITADKITSVNINGYTIEGVYIKGSQISGSIIKSSWIDYTSNGDLTNWQYYTPATIPAGYEANFAHDNNGALLVDTQGYVRLIGIFNLFGNANGSSVTAGYYFGTFDAYGGTFHDNVFCYSSYTIANSRRCVYSNIKCGSYNHQLMTSSTKINGALYSSTSLSFKYNNQQVQITNSQNYVRVYLSGAQILAVSIGSGSVNIGIFTLNVSGYTDANGYFHGDITISANANSIAYTDQLNISGFITDMLGHAYAFADPTCPPASLAYYMPAWKVEYV